MMDWTDRHCRYFHRILAPDARLYTEMVHAQAVLLGDRERLLGFDPTEHPVALQIGGSEPAQLAAATRIGFEQGYDEVNLNVGCPSDRVQAGRFGACLLREPEWVGECVAAMRAAAPSGAAVTVKCRIGVDEQDERESLFALADAVAGAGCELLIVHARKAWLQGLSPKENREIPPLNYDIVRTLRAQRPGLRIVLNGGMLEAAEAAALAAEFDGVMLGRAAYHTPYVLHELQQLLFTPNAPLTARQDLLRALESYVESHRAQGAALKHIVRHVLGLFHGQPGGRAFRQILSEGSHRPECDWDLVECALQATVLRKRAA